MVEPFKPPRAGGYEVMVEAAERVVRLLGGRWTLAALGELSVGGRRYQELHDALDGISHKVLTDTLRRAERDGRSRAISTTGSRPRLSTS